METLTHSSLKKVNSLLRDIKAGGLATGRISQGSSLSRGEGGKRVEPYSNFVDVNLV